MADLMQRLGETLHIARRRAKKTIRDVSTETGISPTIISLVETGKRPQVSFDLIAHLACALQVSLDQVITECLGEMESEIESEFEPAGVALVGT